MNFYCQSRFQTKRFPTRVVPVGSVLVGGDQPIRVQSMTNTPTEDVAATVKQCIALAEAGCEIVRITAPNVAAAQALQAIRKEFSDAGFQGTPLVADIHFLPKAAMEAVKHVEKVRVNPGNYADKKKFAILEYTDAQYQEELERLHEAFTPLVLRAQELGRTLRIGTNHGSLSDRIMNRYGDTPLGMVECALEFARISETHNFHDIIFSFKASNPKVMIQAYRLSVKMMQDEDMNYPLHLGVTEAGDGEDARIKSAIGIGSLLADGIGDTIRVSLTEDPVYEIPVAKDLANITHTLWQKTYDAPIEPTHDSIDPFVYTRRETTELQLNDNFTASSNTHPPVFIKPPHPLDDYKTVAKEVIQTNNTSPDAKVEGLIFDFKNVSELPHVTALLNILKDPCPSIALDLCKTIATKDLANCPKGAILCREFSENEADLLNEFLQFTTSHNLFLAIDVTPAALIVFQKQLEARKPTNLIITSTKSAANTHAIGTYRTLTETLKNFDIPQPLIWIRNTPANTINLQDFFTSHILETSIFSGNLLCDGIGDILSIETGEALQRSNALGYNILQGTRLRLTKTEFVACPSCGRTLFDLETTTQAIRKETGHLKGVTIAIMGCIVNGPGEMADADFGYVGGAPEKINLYVGKECVQYNIPQAEAVELLIDLIKKHNKWIDPKPLEFEAITH